MSDDAAQAREFYARELDRDGEEVAALLWRESGPAHPGSVNDRIVRAMLAFAAQPQSREERVNVQTVLAYEAGQSDANAAMRAHFAKMQDMARRYLMSAGGYDDTRLIADMLVALDGPEQRAAFPDEAAPAPQPLDPATVEACAKEATRYQSPSCKCNQCGIIRGIAAAIRALADHPVGRVAD